MGQPRKKRSDFKFKLPKLGRKPSACKSRGKCKCNWAAYGGPCAACISGKHCKKHKRGCHINCTA